MWNGEGFVQIQMRYVAAKLPRRAQADHRVHVRAIDVDLTAVLMHDVADFGYAGFKHTVRGRIGDHQRSQMVTVLFGFGAQIIHVDIAFIIARHDHHLHIGHRR